MRSAAAATDLEKLVPGLRVFSFAGEESPLSGEALQALEVSDRVFSTVPPTRSGASDSDFPSSSSSSSSSPSPSPSSSLIDPVLAAHGPEVFSSARFVGYVSSTSVYESDLGGQTVDEDSELKPDTAAGVLRARAESEWREAAVSAFSSFSSPRGLRLAIVRAGGIYGPGRSALDSEEVLGLGPASSEPPPSSSSEAASSEKDETDAASPPPSPARQLPQEADRPTARVHVLDLCRLLRAQAVFDEREEEERGEEREGEGGDITAPSVVFVICNAVDRDPVPRSAALLAARGLLGLEGQEEQAREAAAAAGEEQRQGAAAAAVVAEARGKVVSGERTWSLSGISPLFPSVFGGLEGIFKGDVRPFGEGRVPERRGKRGRRRGGGGVN